MRKIDIFDQLIFDSNGIDKNGKKISISNSTKSIINLLENSPIIAIINNKKKLVGTFYNVHSRTNDNSLYYGNIYILDKYPQFRQFEITNHSINYQEPPINNIYEAINIVTYIKAIP